MVLSLSIPIYTKTDDHGHKLHPSEPMNATAGNDTMQHIGSLTRRDFSELPHVQTDLAIATSQ
jgi:hypothetical protein